jgi:hypothetical protein
MEGYVGGFNNSQLQLVSCAVVSHGAHAKCSLSHACRHGPRVRTPSPSGSDTLSVSFVLSSNNSWTIDFLGVVMMPIDGGPLVMSANQFTTMAWHGARQLGWASPISCYS